MRHIAAIVLAAVLSACATGPVGPARSDTLFSRVQVGMTQDDVRGVAGAPDEVMPFPLSHTYSWAYYYLDAFGYYSLWSATFAADGHVVSTFSRRLNDGGDHGK